MKKPNIIYFFCDDLGWGDVSFQNSGSKISTPHIDALAASGTSFSDAHAASAVCTPSRYSLLTGQYCWRTGVLKDHVNGGYSPGLIREGRKTVMNRLQEIGYDTACIGKWHIGMDWKITEGEIPPQDLMDHRNEEIEKRIDFSATVKNGPCDAVFDYFYGISASLDMPPYSWIENNRLTELPTEQMCTGTEEKRCSSGAMAPGWSNEAVLPSIRDKSIDDIKTHTDNPFFLYIPVNGPHTPVVPNKEWIGKSSCGIYGDFVMEIDDTLGKIVQAVKEAGLEEDTLIVFSSDNGPETLTMKYREQFHHHSSWRFRGWKRDNWEGGHRVPLIFSWPGAIEAGRREDRPVELIDFAATVRDICRIEREEDFCEDSFSMVPLLFNREMSISKQAEQFYRDFFIHHSWDGRWAIRKGKWKLLLHSGSGGNECTEAEMKEPLQLYNMEADPYETTNLYKEHKSLVEELTAMSLKIIRRGRSTEGKDQPLKANHPWPQLDELSICHI